MGAHRLSVWLLSFQALPDGCVLVSVPLKEPVHLVESDNKGRLAGLQQANGLNGLRLQAVHEIHHQDGNVTQI